MFHEHGRKKKKLLVYHKEQKQFGKKFWLSSSKRHPHSEENSDLSIRLENQIMLQRWLNKWQAMQFSRCNCAKKAISENGRNRYDNKLVC